MSTMLDIERRVYRLYRDCQSWQARGSFAFATGELKDWLVELREGAHARIGPSASSVIGDHLEEAIAAYLNGRTPEEVAAAWTGIPERIIDVDDPYADYTDSQLISA
jgi:hypothetical protein